MVRAAFAQVALSLTYVYCVCTPSPRPYVASAGRHHERALRDYNYRFKIVCQVLR